jgi:hypothetical protein
MLVKYSESLLGSVAWCIMSLGPRDNPLSLRLKCEFINQESIQEIDNI